MDTRLEDQFLLHLIFLLFMCLSYDQMVLKGFYAVFAEDVFLWSFLSDSPGIPNMMKRCR